MRKFSSSSEEKEENEDEEEEPDAEAASLFSPSLFAKKNVVSTLKKTCASLGIPSLVSTSAFNRFRRTFCPSPFS
jgi:hypothetical protein